VDIRVVFFWGAESGWFWATIWIPAPRVAGEDARSSVAFGKPMPSQMPSEAHSISHMSN